QAEDGIRDFHVTGVQTCALPILIKVLVDGVKPTITAVSISSNNADSSWAKVGDEVTLRFSVSEYTDQLEVQIAGMPVTASRGGRSEERRVGKECRSRWSA